MNVSDRIKAFDRANAPLYLVDHEDGCYSLCLAFTFLKDEYADFGQEAFNDYAAG